MYHGRSRSYPQILEKLGFKKETDWVEYRITFPEELPQKYYQFADLIVKKYNLNVRKVSREIFLSLTPVWSVLWKMTRES